MNFLVISLLGLLLAGTTSALAQPLLECQAVREYVESGGSRATAIIRLIDVASRFEVGRCNKDKRVYVCLRCLKDGDLGMAVYIMMPGGDVAPSFFGTCPCEEKKW